MAKFLTELDVELRSGSDKIWILKSPLIYKSDFLGTIEIPEGFETDFASVPRVPIVFTLYGNRAHREAVIHDYLYRINAIPSATFSQANDVFLEAMKVRDKKWYVRWPMYLGVRFGGLSSYHKRKV